MGGPRKRVAGAIDGVIGGLSTVRDRIEPDGEEADPDDDVGPGTVGSDGTTAAGDDERTADTGGEDLPATDDAADVPTTTNPEDDGGIAAGLRDYVSATVEYQKTVLRHPIASQRAHVAAVAEESPLSRSFWSELALVSGSTQRRRVERIRRQLEDDRTVRDDVRSVAEAVDWQRTWRYGKVGFVAGRKFRKRSPVPDRYAPIAGAVAAGAYGAISANRDEDLVETDPERVFDRIDAVAQLRDDPVRRAQVARDALHEVDRRLGSTGDPVTVEDLVSDRTVADLVTADGEAVPDEIPHDPATRRLLADDPLIADLLQGGPLDSRTSPSRGLPSADATGSGTPADLPLDDPAAVDATGDDPDPDATVDDPDPDATVDDPDPDATGDDPDPDATAGDRNSNVAGDGETGRVREDGDPDPAESEER